MADSQRKPGIAIAGATGELGTWLTESFLSDAVRPKVSDLVLLSRRHTPNTRSWQGKGAAVRVLEDADDLDEIVDALEGVDVLVNAISTAGAKLRDNLVKALPRTSVKLYFPSEFGVDHTMHDFGIEEWDGKKQHLELTRHVVAGTKTQICRLFIGLFLHNGIGPWYGMHVSKNVYQAIGSLDQSVSYTDLGDVAKVIIILAVEALAGRKVPESLRIAGTHASVRRTADLMSAAGAGEIELRSVELLGFRDKALSRPYNDRNAIVCLRFLMGDGRIDYRPMAEGGLGNDNEIVNPGQKYFQWKTVEDLARETKGRPSEVFSWPYF